MANHMLVLEYDGTAYHGFQKQPGLPTIQGALEEALSRVSRLESPLYGAGRTDAGVPARGQVVSFRGRSLMPPERLPVALNALLPPGIAVKACLEVSDSFNARGSALAREYAYYLQAGGYPSPFTRRYVYHHRGELDQEAMSEALDAVAGVHDFAAFCRCERGKSSMREVYEVGLTRRDRIIAIRVKANAFAWMMMRMLCGGLLEVGRGRWTVDRFREVLESRETSHGAMTLPPHGLFLERVYYPERDPHSGRGSAMSGAPKS